MNLMHANISRPFLNKLYPEYVKLIVRSLTLTARSSQVKVGVIGAPMHFGQQHAGVQFGPQCIRQAGLIDKLQNHEGLDVKDWGDVKLCNEDTSQNYTAEETRLKNINENAQFNFEISKRVADVLRSSDICVTLGGDHSAAIGTISGHASVRSNLSVLWVDAHPDLNTHKTSPSGNIHGMPLHFLLHDLESRRSDAPQFDWCKPCVSSPNIGFLAIRDIDPGEIALLKRFNIPHCSIREIDRNGIAHCMEKLLDMINPSGNRPIHLSYDIDSVDPVITASTGTPVLGGLTYREAMYVSEEVARTGCLSAMDLVEVNPKLGSQEEADSTASVAVDVITHALGLSIRDTYFRRFTSFGTTIV